MRWFLLFFHTFPNKEARSNISLNSNNSYNTKRNRPVDSASSMIKYSKGQNDVTEQGICYTGIENCSAGLWPIDHAIYNQLSVISSFVNSHIMVNFNTDMVINTMIIHVDLPCQIPGRILGSLENSSQQQQHSDRIYLTTQLTHPSTQLSWRALASSGGLSTFQALTHIHTQASVKATKILPMMMRLQK